MTSSKLDFEIYKEFIIELTELVKKKTPFILAIDGMCGSGKTTLADYLSTRFSAQIIHMDNFFLPFERKTQERLSEAGGNVDYERFTQIILPALKKGEPFSYTAYNCQTASYDCQVTIGACDLIIVEGSYSLHEKFGNYYDYALFLTVSPEEQLERLKIRCNDETKFLRFQEDWIPMEQHYHEVQNVLYKCNKIIDTTT